MICLYSASTDKIYPQELLCRYPQLPNDLIVLTEEETSFHMGNTVIPDDKQRKKHCYPFELENIPPLSTHEQAAIAQSLMIEHLSWADLEIKKHIEGHERTTSTLDKLYQFKNQCRNYVRSSPDGDLAITPDAKEPVRPS